MEVVDFFSMGTGENIREAFNSVKRRAVEINGSKPNTGSVADKQSYVFIMKTISVQEAHAWACRLLDEKDPRVSHEDSPAGVIEVQEDPMNRKRWLFFGRALHD